VSEINNFQQSKTNLASLEIRFIPDKCKTISRRQVQTLKGGLFLHHLVNLFSTHLFTMFNQLKKLYHGYCYATCTLT